MTHIPVRNAGKKTTPTHSSPQKQHPLSSRSSRTLRRKNLTQTLPKRFSVAQKREPESHKMAGSTSAIGWSRKMFLGILDTALVAVIAVLIFGLPLFTLGTTFQGIAFEKHLFLVALLLVGFILWFIKGIVLARFSIRRTPIDIPLLVFWGTMLLTTLFSYDRFQSTTGAFGDPSRGFLTLTLGIGLYYLVTSHVTFTRLIAWLVLLIASYSLVLIGAILHLFYGSIPVVGETFTLGSYAALGVYAGSMLPIVLGGISALGQEEVPRWIRALLTVLLGIIALFTIVVLFILGQVSAWVIALVGVSFFLIFSLGNIVRLSREAVMFAFGTFVVVLFGLFLGNVGFSRDDIPTEIAPSYAASWDVARKGLNDNLFFGAGPGLYEEVFSKYRPIELHQTGLSDAQFGHASGLINETLPTLGAIGTGAGVVFLLLTLGTGIFLLLRLNARIRAVSLGFWAAGVAFLWAALSGVINGALLYSFLSVFVLLFAIPMTDEKALSRRSLKFGLHVDPKYSLALSFVLIVLLGLMVLLGASTTRAFLADVALKKAQELKTLDADTAQIAAQLDRAVELAPKRAEYRAEQARLYMSLSNTEALKPETDRDTNVVIAYLRSAIAAAEEAQKLDPNSIHVAKVVAQIFENASYFTPDFLERSLTEQRRLMEMEPNNPHNDLKVGQTLLKQAVVEDDITLRDLLLNEAEEHLKHALEIAPEFAEAYYELSFLAEARQDLSQAIEYMSQATQVSPSNILYYYHLARLYQERNESDDLPRAEQIYREILGVVDTDSNVHFSLGLLYKETGRAEEAIAEFERVLELLPEEATQESRSQIQDQINKLQFAMENITSNDVISDDSSAETEIVKESEVNNDADTNSDLPDPSTEEDEEESNEIVEEDDETAEETESFTDETTNN